MSAEEEHPVPTVAAPANKLTAAQVRRRGNAAAQRAVAAAARKRPRRDYDVLHGGPLTEEHRALFRQMREREHREEKTP